MSCYQKGVALKVDVRLTEEQKAAVPGFEKRLKRFQREVGGWTKRDIFRLCIHEGGHVWAYRKFGVTVDEFHGPNVKVKYGEPSWAYGSVTRDASSLSDWMRAAASAAGYLAVEVLTGKPEEPNVIENDNLGHEKWDLGVGEIFIRSELSESLHELLSAAREYEVRVFGTDEIVLWGINEHRIFHPGERYAVGLSFTGGFATLLEHRDGKLRLYVDGREHTPLDKIYDYEPEVIVPYGPKRDGVEEVVKLWNCVVAATYITHPQLGSGAALQPLESAEN
jgi:hypothetical protein